MNTADSAPPLAKILVVDDELPQMRAICNTLQDHGYATTGFSGGTSALAEIRPGRFDLLITDLMMPGMDGIAVLKAAQKLDPDLVMILMTGAGTIASAVEAMKVGAFDYLLKPFKLSELLPVLGRALAVRNLRLENAALQRAMRERTAELEIANRELETFAYSVSHDLRAPLRGIQGLSRILLEDFQNQLDATGQDYQRRIAAAAMRMSGLIDDMLNLAQVGRSPLDLRPVDLSALAREVFDELRAREPARTVETEIQPDLTVVADGRLLRIVLDNLLGNAWKFTGKNPAARIACARRDTPAGPAFTVTDNGAGFDLARAATLFTPFRRFHNANEFPGTGIGLATVRRVIERHHGKVWAESVVGSGTTFFFTLEAGPDQPVLVGAE